MTRTATSPAWKSPCWEAHNTKTGEVIEAPYNYNHETFFFELPNFEDWQMVVVESGSSDSWAVGTILNLHSDGNLYEVRKTVEQGDERA